MEAVVTSVFVMRPYNNGADAGPGAYWVADPDAVLVPVQIERGPAIDASSAGLARAVEDRDC